MVSLVDQESSLLYFYYLGFSWESSRLWVLWFSACSAVSSYQLKKASHWVCATSLLGFFFLFFFFPPIFYQIWKSQKETVQGDHPRYSCFIIKTKQTKWPTNLPILVIFVYKLGWAPIKGNLPHFGQSSAHLYSVSHTHTCHKVKLQGIPACALSSPKRLLSACNFKGTFYLLLRLTFIPRCWFAVQISAHILITPIEMTALPGSQPALQSHQDQCISSPTSD